MNDKERKAFLLLLQYFRNQEVKLEEDAKKCVEAFERDIKKQEEEQKKLKMMYDHPEWFEVTSPKEFGIKKLGKRKR